MIKFRHDGPQMSCWKAYWKRYDDANASRWNLEVEPFVARRVIQMEEDTHGLGVIKDHMSP
jgi:hypothetical protein